MPLAARLNDKCTQPDGYRETVITAGSPTVFIGGVTAARLSYPLTLYDKPEHSMHPRKIASGSPTISSDCLRAARNGDVVDCGGVIMSTDIVNIG